MEPVFLNSSLSLSESQKTKAKILKGDVKLVYVSPEGILSSNLGSFFDQLKISLIAIDEAHCVSQWGHEFRKNYSRLGVRFVAHLDLPKSIESYYQEMRRARYRGRSKLQTQIYIISTVQNLKRKAQTFLSLIKSILGEMKCAVQMACEMRLICQNL